ncbi:MAG TPA: hypothetical protein PLB74_03445 [Candidatus Paceibacterota bacterium]|nr:hypothetical protein [Candidatus Paceibacterota bacterium]
MARTFVNNNGLIIKMYSKKEQDETWASFDAYDKMVKSPDHIKYTTDRNCLPYQLLKKVEQTYDTFVKTNKVVAKLFGK